MNKDYLPFYDSLKDDDKEFWLNCTKEQLIDHIVSNIRNGETLLSRIDKAIEYIEKHKETREHYEPIGTPMGNPNYITTHISGYYELLNILKGEE